MTTTEQYVSITPLAAEKIRAIMSTEGEEELGLRVFVTGGGCSGLSYGMALDNSVNDDDIVADLGGIRVLIDEQTATYVKGAEIDYIDQLMGGGFTLHNPNAVSTCACGHSFKTEADQGTPGACGH